MKWKKRAFFYSFFVKTIKARPKKAHHVRQETGPKGWDYIHSNLDIVNLDIVNFAM